MKILLDKGDKMKFHIVGNGECVDDILKGYDISIDELKNENKHIRIWDYLIPGTKLKIPVLTESIIEDINEIEPFIEDYYPKLKIEDDYKQIIEEVEEIEIEPKEEIIEYHDNINVVEEDNQDKVEEVIEKNINDNYNRNNNQVVYKYVYPQPYYYRPIVYVIPRNKRT